MSLTIKESNITCLGIALKITEEPRTIDLTAEALHEWISCEIASDNLALLINSIGKINKAWQSTSCLAADDLTEEGRQFIEDMHYFINGGE